MVGVALSVTVAAGCATSASAPGLLVALVMALSVGWLGASCSESRGYWAACCRGGVIDSCYCGGGAICNYYYADCGDGTCGWCAWDAAVGDAAVDAGTDAGEWQGCCEDGVVTSCYCPAGVECNYGWYTPCGEGTCVDSWTTCPGADAGVDGSADAVAVP
jgi:hypothetical protein